ELGLGLQVCIRGWHGLLLAHVSLLHLEPSGREPDMDGGAGVGAQHDAVAPIELHADLGVLVTAPAGVVMELGLMVFHGPVPGLCHADHQVVRHVDVGHSSASRSAGKISPTVPVQRSHLLVYSPQAQVARTSTPTSSRLPENVSTNCDRERSRSVAGSTETAEHGGIGGVLQSIPCLCS